MLHSSSKIETSNIKCVRVWRRNVLVKSHRDLDNVGDSAGIELHVIDHRTPQLCYGLLSEPFIGVTHTTVPV